MRTFAVMWDYRCPFARNANEHVIAGLADGAEWNVSFVPFSLGQVHVADGDPPIWDRPDDDSGLLALQVGTAVRDVDGARFPAVHRDLFALRHDQGGDLRNRDALTAVLERHGVDVAAVFALVDDGRALKAVRDAHETAVAEHHVWGVPTFVSGANAVFVRLMHRPDDEAVRDQQRAAERGPSADMAVRTIERVLDLIDGFVDLNEFKHTAIPR